MEQVTQDAAPIPAVILTINQTDVKNYIRALRAATHWLEGRGLKQYQQRSLRRLEVLLSRTYYQMWGYDPFYEEN